MTEGRESWVSDWFPPAAPPGTYSVTVPVTSTASPARTVGELLVKTKRPSLVAGSPSGRVSWNQKPREPYVRTPVTTPGTASTRCPASGERRVVPWMSWMRTAASAAACGEAATSRPAPSAAAQRAATAGERRSSAARGTGRAGEPAMERTPKVVENGTRDRAREPVRRAGPGPGCGSTRVNLLESGGVVKGRRMYAG